MLFHETFFHASCKIMIIIILIKIKISDPSLLTSICDFTVTRKN